MNDFYSVWIHGDFTTGYLITGANSFNSANSTYISSGGIFNTSVSKTGSIGIRVAFGDTTRVVHTSVENWEGHSSRIQLQRPLLRPVRGQHPGLGSSQRRYQHLLHRSGVQHPH